MTAPTRDDGLLPGFARCPICNVPVYMSYNAIVSHNWGEHGGPSPLADATSSPEPPSQAAEPVCVCEHGKGMHSADGEGGCRGMTGNYVYDVYCACKKFLTALARQDEAVR